MNLIEVVTSTLSQAKIYLHQLSATAYALPLDMLSGASVGQHTRHVLEFYDCLLTQFPSGEINYDKRCRNRQIESDPAFAAQLIDQICQELTEVDLDESLTLAHGYDLTGTQGNVVRVQTTFARELLYNVEHAIHHLAMIKIGLKILAPQMELPEAFGVAPSTIRHQKESKENIAR